MIWMLVGSARHKDLKAGEDSDSIVEQRLSTIIDDQPSPFFEQYFELYGVFMYHFVGIDITLHNISEAESDSDKCTHLTLIDSAIILMIAATLSFY